MQCTYLMTIESVRNTDLCGGRSVTNTNAALLPFLLGRQRVGHDRTEVVYWWNQQVVKAQQADGKRHVLVPDRTDNGVHQLVCSVA